MSYFVHSSLVIYVKRDTNLLRLTESSTNYKPTPVSLQGPQFHKKAGSSLCDRVGEEFKFGGRKCVKEEEEMSGQGWNGPPAASAA